ncbi:MAG TPA: hypothetical protein VG347_13570 [Verrucomicrobiae bacterium]|nr:hypothetical protein [Verrucomicrobiae bacterium]
MKKRKTHRRRTIEPLQLTTRKPIRSKLDPFTNELLQMDQDKTTFDKMLEWLIGQRIKCSRNALHHFITTRRTAREHNHLLEHLAKVTAKSHVVVSHLAKNPAPQLDTIMQLLRVVATQLTAEATIDTDLIKLANQLTHTTLNFELIRLKTKLVERNLVLAEEKHAEWIKCEQTRALEACLKEAKKFPLVARSFRAAFHALRDTQTPALREIENPPSPAWSAKASTKTAAASTSTATTQ